MDEWRPYRTYRRLRLDELVAEAGGPKKLMELTGVTDTHITACQKGRRPIGDDMAEKLERKMERPFGWMDTPPQTIQQAGGADIPSRQISLAVAIARLAEAVAAAPPDRIPALAENMAGWVKSTAREPWTGIVTQLLTPQTQSTLEVANPLTAAELAEPRVKGEV